MNSILRGIGGGFGRSVGRILGLIFIAFLFYILIKYLDIDIKSIIPKVSIGGLLY